MSNIQVRIAFLVVLMAIVTFVLGHGYLAKALKVGSAVAYIAIFYVAIWAMLAYLSTRPRKPNSLLMIVGASVLGHLIAACTSFAMHLAQPQGIERLLNSVQRTGVLDMLLIYLVFPVLLGGWLLAPIAVLLYAIAIQPKLYEKMPV